MRLNGVTIARPHGEKEAFRQRASESVSVFRIQLWTAALLLMGSSAAWKLSSSGFDALPDRAAGLESLSDGGFQSWRALGVDLESAARRICP